MTKMKNNEIKETLELLEQALAAIKKVNNEEVNIPTDEIECWIKACTIANTYGIAINEIELDYDGEIKLEKEGMDFIIQSAPCLINKKNNYQFVEGENYVQVGSGSIDRLMFLYTMFLHNGYFSNEEIDRTWEDFEAELLSYNPLDWDKPNFRYVYDMKAGLKLYKDFDEIYARYRERFDEIIRKTAKAFIAQKKEELRKMHETLK